MCKCSSTNENGQVDYQYAVKVVCGVIDPKDKNPPLPVGEYKTKVNVHNFSRCECVTFRWKVALGEPGLKVGPISDFSDATLCADDALEIDIYDMLKKLGRTVPGQKHFEGWVVIECPSELDVVAVYGTAPTPGGGVDTFHTERVPARCLPVCDDFFLDMSTGVSLWQVSGPHPGLAPAGAVFTDAALGSIDGHWGSLPGAMWIHPQGGDTQPEGVYTYRLKFKLCSGFGNALIEGQMLSDYFGNAYLNGALISSPLQTGGPNYSSPIAIHATTHFKTGENELIVLVNNKEQGTTGLALHGDIEVQAGLCAGEAMPLLCCPGVEYNAYLQKYPLVDTSIGFWQGTRHDGEMAGTTGQNRRVEKIMVTLTGCLYQGTSIEYSVRSAPLFGGATWVGPARDGDEIGWEHHRMEMVRMHLINAPLHCRLQYRVYMRHNQWSDWGNDGDEVGTSGSNRRIEAIEIRIV